MVYIWRYANGTAFRICNCVDRDDAIDDIRRFYEATYGVELNDMSVSSGQSNFDPNDRLKLVPGQSLAVCDRMWRAI